MKLEKQVCSLELAKKLKELGVKQDSIFHWCWDVETPYILFQEELPKFANKDYANRKIMTYNEAKYSSAFTVAELGEMLPNPLEGKIIGGYKFFGSEHVGSEWECGSDKMLEHTFTDKFEANARAKMLIYLKENNLINQP